MREPGSVSRRLRVWVWRGNGAGGSSERGHQGHPWAVPGTAWCWQMELRLSACREGHPGGSSEKGARRPRALAGRRAEPETPSRACRRHSAVGALFSRLLPKLAAGPCLGTGGTPRGGTEVEQSGSEPGHPLWTELPAGPCLVSPAGAGIQAGASLLDTGVRGSHPLGSLSAQEVLCPVVLRVKNQWAMCNEKVISSAHRPHFLCSVAPEARGPHPRHISLESVPGLTVLPPRWSCRGWGGPLWWVLLVPTWECRDLGGSPRGLGGVWQGQETGTHPRRPQVLG